MRAPRRHRPRKRVMQVPPDVELDRLADQVTYVGSPSSGLRQRVSRPVVDHDDIDELAAAFGVSSWVIAHQIRNHHVAAVRDTASAIAP